MAVALAAAAALPALLAILALIACLGALVGFHPFWPTRTATLSEAAATGDAAAISILFETGADPNGTYDVRPGTLGNDKVLRLTPLEAAISYGDLENFRLLVDRGAEVRGKNGIYMACLARIREATQITDYLRERGTVVDEKRCEGVALPY